MGKSSFGDVYDSGNTNMEFGDEDAGQGTCYHVAQYILVAYFLPSSEGFDTANTVSYGVPDRPGSWSGELKWRECCICCPHRDGYGGGAQEHMKSCPPPNIPKQDSGNAMNNCKKGQQRGAPAEFDLPWHAWPPSRGACSRVISRSFVKEICSPCGTKNCRCRAGSTTDPGPDGDFGTPEDNTYTHDCEWKTEEIVGGNGKIGGTPSLSESDIVAMCPDSGDSSWPGRPNCSRTEYEDPPGTGPPPGTGSPPTPL